MHLWGARLSSLIFFLYSNRFTSISQQRNCLLLPRVQWRALVPAGGATSTLWSGVLQCRGACSLCIQGWRNRVDLSYLGVWLTDQEVASSHSVWVSPITSYRTMTCHEEWKGRKDLVHITQSCLGLLFMQCAGSRTLQKKLVQYLEQYYKLIQIHTHALHQSLKHFVHEQYRWVPQRISWKWDCYFQL